MANKGTFKGKTLMSEQTWNDLHSEPKVVNTPLMYSSQTMRNSFTKAGFCEYKKEYMIGPKHSNSLGEAQFQTGRDGFFGW